MIFMRLLFGLFFFITACIFWLKSPQPSDSNKRNEQKDLPIAIERSRGNEIILSFPQAKKILKNGKIPNPKTFYCPCPWKDSTVLYGKSCEYKPYDPHNERAYKIEWEHVVPAEVFGKHFEAWKTGDPSCIQSKNRPYKGRRCAQKVSEQFRKMEADLYNLVPSIGEVNQIRSNKSMGYVKNNLYSFGPCSVKMDQLHIEPDSTLKGFVARVYLYMDQAYPGFDIIKSHEKSLFEEWHTMHPVTKEEKERGLAIEMIQKNKNPYLL